MPAEQVLGRAFRRGFPAPLTGNLTVGCICNRPARHLFDADNILKHAMDSANTDTAQPRDGMTEPEIAAAGTSIPWGRIGQPDDVARAVLYLASPMAEFVAGETLRVTGGATLLD